ncbi:MAG TPA: BlaI/MecI/CopY family transcriptional regulator [Bryobacteraceae bacterium]|nr:BlaI/MecI/CopY family transcriptional regulator [Bryobacteraceae bacterium]
MPKDRELPPPLEMACLNALWELGEGNVEEVRVCVSRARPLAYTTVLTLLDRLSRRGAVSRRKEGRGFRYQPAIDRDKLRRLALTQFLDHHFNGSVDTLREFLSAVPQEPLTLAVAVGSTAGAAEEVAASAAAAGDATVRDPLA